MDEYGEGTVMVGLSHDGSIVVQFDLSGQIVELTLTIWLAERLVAMLNEVLEYEVDKR